MLALRSAGISWRSLTIQRAWLDLLGDPARALVEDA